MAFITPGAVEQPGGNGGSLPAEWTVDANGGLTISPDIPTSKALKLKPATGATADFDNVFEIYDDVGRTLLEIDAGGDFLMRSAVGEDALFEVRLDDVQFNDAARKQLAEFGVHSGFDFYTPPTSGFVVWKRDGPGNGPMFSLTTDPETVIFQLLTTAPPDARIGPGFFSFWLDDTNGAGKLMVKAGTADGTIVTGQVALT